MNTNDTVASLATQVQSLSPADRQALNAALDKSLSALNTVPQSAAATATPPAPAKESMKTSTKVGLGAIGVLAVGTAGFFGYRLLNRE